MSDFNIKLYFQEVTVCILWKHLFSHPASVLDQARAILQEDEVRNKNLFLMGPA